MVAAPTLIQYIPRSARDTYLAICGRIGAERFFPRVNALFAAKFPPDWMGDVKSL